MPKVEVEEMGPRIDFRVGRQREADPDMWKEAMRKPKGQEVRLDSGYLDAIRMLTTVQAKTKKNIETDIVGDKMGRIHLGKQDLGQLQTRKMKGLKRSRDVADDEGAFAGADDDGGVLLPDADKRARVEA